MIEVGNCWSYICQIQAMAESWGLDYAGFQYMNCVGNHKLSIYIPFLLEIDSERKVYVICLFHVSSKVLSMMVG